jgi:Polyketide cyclase / dehydrase and lipid transport
VEIKMTVIKHEFSANCRPEAVWMVLSDLVAVADYNPTVRTARIIGDQTRGKGAVRQCELVPKGEVVERVTVYDEGKALGLEVIQSDWPITSMQWVTRIEPKEHASRVSQELEYHMKYGAVGWLLNALVMRRAVTKNVGAALQAMIAKAEKAQ